MTVCCYGPSAALLILKPPPLLSMVSPTPNLVVVPNTAGHLHYQSLELKHQFCRQAVIWWPSIWR
jgi:hypothetical protein